MKNFYLLTGNKGDILITVSKYPNQKQMASLLRKVEIFIGKDIYVHNELFDEEHVSKSEWLGNMNKVHIIFPTKYRAEYVPFNPDESVQKTWQPK